jgi:pantetheine-phosphate adenylyltransferase
MTNYIFPGTFDPITYGHIAVVKKFFSLMSEDDKLFLSVSSSALKKPILFFDERFKLAKSIFSSNEIYEKKVYIEKIIGNTAEFIYKKQGICVRGIRNLDDLRYESYWPVSRSSKHPVDIFLLIPVFNENSQYISSTFFKNQISDLLLKQNKSYKDVYTKLSSIAPIETVNLFYDKYFDGKAENGQKSSFQLDKVIGERISCIVADHNIVDYGQLEFIKNSLNLSDKLIIFVPEVIQHQRIEFQERFNLLSEILKEWNNSKIQIVSCVELKIFQDIATLMEKYRVTQFFFEMREYHTRNEERLKAVFEQMNLLFRINIDLIIVLQERFRDISQPLLFNICYDDCDSEIEIVDSALNQYIPEASFKVLREFVINN